MQRLLRLGALISCLFMLSASAGGLNTRSLTLIYSGNLDGELEPCGCTEVGNMGGLKRRATVIEQTRQENPHTVVISSGGLLANESSRDQLKSDFILRGIAMMDYDAIGVQWRDIAYGPEFIQQRELPWVSSNWLDEQMPAVQRFERGGQVVSVFSWLDPASSPMRQMQGGHELVGSDPSALRDALRKAKAAGELTILTTTLDAEAVATLLPLDAIDILIGKSAYEEYGEPRHVGSTLVLQPGSRGMRMGRLDLQLTEAGRIAGAEHRIIPMPPAVPDAPRLAGWYETYNAKLKEEYLKRVELRKQLESGESPYAGAEVCKTCHVTQHRIWQQSEHPKAYVDLEAVNKAFDSFCLSCHTVGFEKPGGFIDLQLTDHLTGVQCESCHGAGRAHADSGGQQPVAHHDWPRSKICAQCHNHEQSPTFNMEHYWPKVAH